MNVPAWPMPIHQTKLMIANAQATGMLLPHTPMPVEHGVARSRDEEQQRAERRQATAATRTARRVPERREQPSVSAASPDGRA